MKATPDPFSRSRRTPAAAIGPAALLGFALWMMRIPCAWGADEHAGIGSILMASRNPHVESSAPVMQSVLQDPPLPVVTNQSQWLTNVTNAAAAGVPAAPSAGTPGTNHEPLLAELPASTNLVLPPKKVDHSAELERLRILQVRLDLARQQRRAGEYTQAASGLKFILETNAPPELQRAALFELALVAQDEKQLTRAQQIFAQYLRLYPQDPSAPEILLRQGLLYRQIGATALAVHKFHTVMTTALSLEFGRLDYYQRLVLQARTEIADTYLVAGQLAEAADYFGRLLKLENPELNRAQIHYKLVRCLSTLGRHPETVAQAQAFLDQHAQAPELPEIRYLLANSLKRLSRNEDALRQVMILLQTQREAALQYPENWIYWQKRAGNDVANQLYREGDFMATLEIYQALVELDSTPAWQIPVYYQIGLVFERLQQPAKAVETYTKVLDRQKELKNDQLSPGIKTVLEMARWRKDQIAWLDKATASSQAMR